MIIGVTGLARSGKDTFCIIAKDILESTGKKVKIYSLANQLKKEVAPFLKKMCGVDVWTTNSELKTDIRDFLVWYGTTWWRKREPMRWIKSVKSQMDRDKTVSVKIVSDIRYENEANWVHSNGGILIHVKKYKMKPRLPTSSFDDGPYPGEPLVRHYDAAPNKQEEENDPILKNISDIFVEWEDKGLKSKEEILENKYLRSIVLPIIMCNTLYTDNK